MRRAAGQEKGGGGKGYESLFPASSYLLRTSEGLGRLRVLRPRPDRDRTRTGSRSRSGAGARAGPGRRGRQECRERGGLPGPRTDQAQGRESLCKGGAESWESIRRRRGRLDPPPPTPSLLLLLPPPSSSLALFPSLLPPSSPSLSAWGSGACPPSRGGLLEKGRTGTHLTSDQALGAASRSLPAHLPLSRGLQPPRYNPGLGYAGAAILSRAQPAKVSLSHLHAPQHPFSSTHFHCPLHSFTSLLIPLLTSSSSPKPTPNYSSPIFTPSQTLLFPSSQLYPLQTPSSSHPHPPQTLLSLSSSPICPLSLLHPSNMQIPTLPWTLHSTQDGDSQENPARNEAVVILLEQVDGWYHIELQPADCM